MPRQIEHRQVGLAIIKAQGAFYQFSFQPVNLFCRQERVEVVFNRQQESSGAVK